MCDSNRIFFDNQLSNPKTLWDIEFSNDLIKNNYEDITNCCNTFDL